MINPIPLAYQKITQALTQLSPEEWAKLCRDDYELILQIKKNKAKNQIQPLLSIDTVTTPLNLLMNCETQEQAIILLKQNFKLKSDLVDFARQLDIAINTKDRIADLHTKIIDATLGAKWRSEAILGVKNDVF